VQLCVGVPHAALVRHALFIFDSDHGGSHGTSVHGPGVSCAALLFRFVVVVAHASFLVCLRLCGHRMYTLLSFQVAALPFADETVLRVMKMIEDEVRVCLCVCVCACVCVGCSHLMIFL